MTQWLRVVQLAMAIGSKTANQSHREVLRGYGCHRGYLEATKAIKQPRQSSNQGNLLWVGMTGQIRCIHSVNIIGTVRCQICGDKRHNSCRKPQGGVRRGERHAHNLDNVPLTEIILPSTCTYDKAKHQIETNWMFQ